MAHSFIVQDVIQSIKNPVIAKLNSDYFGHLGSNNNHHNYLPKSDSERYFYHIYFKIALLQSLLYHISPYFIFYESTSVTTVVYNIITRF
jgi:hypothetical protein